MKRSDTYISRLHGDGYARGWGGRTDAAVRLDRGAHDGDRALDADFVRRVLDEAQEGGNRFSFCCAAWELGHDLIGRREYELAAGCFGRLSRFAAGVEDPFLLEAARTAEGLCSAPGCGRKIGGEPREALKLLGRDLACLTREEVDAAAAALAARRGPLPAVGIATEAGALRAAPARRRQEVRPTGDLLAHERQGARARLDVPAGIDLEVRFFGRFELLRGGRPLPLGRNGKAKTILKYLLAQAPRAVSRDLLMEWLWPESAARRARWSLNSAMYAVRGVLNEGGRTRPPEEPVLCEAGFYRLSPNVRVASDVQEFEARYRSGRLLEEAGRTAEAAVEYEGAVDLYRDDYMIEDLYEDWTLIERERLADAYVDSLDRLARHHAGTERIREAMNACYRALEKDPCRESTCRLLMRCYARLGLRHRAIDQYRLSEEILRNRYGTPPSPQTQALYRDLLRGEMV